MVSKDRIKHIDLSMEVKTFHSEEIRNLDKFYRRNLINCLSGFKSINLVGTLSGQGQSNLAPFSQIIHVGADPALMGMLLRPDTVPRHTLANIREQEFYTFNHLYPEMYRKAHQASARYAISEFEACGLTPVFSEKHPAPYVQESHLRIGLHLAEEIRIPQNGTILVIGEVVEIRVPQGWLGEDGFVDLEKGATVTCSGLDSYHITQKLARLSYAKPDRRLEEIGPGK